jgi:hypothetical protein
MLDRNITWDAVSGVTEGAINAYLLSLQGDDVANSLESFWLDVGSSRVYENYEFGLAEAVAFEDGLYKSDPLFDLLD